MDLKRKIKTRVLAKEAFDLMQQWEREREHGSDKQEQLLDGKFAGLRELLSELSLPTTADDLEHLYWKLLQDD